MLQNIVPIVRQDWLNKFLQLCTNIAGQRCFNNKKQVISNIDGQDCVNIYKYCLPILPENGASTNKKNVKQY